MKAKGKLADKGKSRPYFDRFDPRFSAISARREAMQGQYEKLVVAIADMPHLSPDTREAKMLSNLYDRAANSNPFYSATIREFGSGDWDSKAMKDLGFPKLKEARIVLENLCSLGLVTYGTDAERIYVKLSDLGMKVGFVISERAAARSLLRKKVPVIG